MLEIQRDRARYDIVTLDESWFHLTVTGRKVPERQQHMIQSKMFKFTIVWNPPVRFNQSS
jgi:hypothetical protein